MERTIRRALAIGTMILALGACRGGGFRCDPSPSWTVGDAPDAGMATRERCTGECFIDEVRLGPRHTCIEVYPDAEVVCFGANEAGQSAPHLDAPVVPPTKVGQRANQEYYRDLALGELHSCAIHEAATICWGSADVLGAPEREPRVIATTLAPEIIGSGALHTCIEGYESGRAVECFGAWDGIDPGSAAHTPRRRPDLSVPGSSVVLGAFSECQLRDWPTDDDMAQYFPYCWGGTPPPGPFGPGAWNASPRELFVAGISAFDFPVSTGPVVTCLADAYAYLSWRPPGGIVCIGDGRRGGLGNGDLAITEAPGQPARAEEPLAYPCVGGRVDIVRGDDGLQIGETVGGHVCAVGSESVWCWGANDRGQLGDGTTEDRSMPVRVEGLPASEYYLLACGGERAGVLTADGVLWCWGDNRWGQLGVEGPGLRAVPERVWIAGAFE